METYVNQVCDIQALDAVPVRKEPISLPAFLDRQKAKYTMLVGAHALRFERCCGELRTTFRITVSDCKSVSKKTAGTICI